MPVPEAEQVVQPWRTRYTEDGAEGMPPHITLLYPFTDTDAVDADDVGHVLRRFEPVEFTLASTGRFTGIAPVLYLAPTPDAPFRAMTAALTGAFPEYTPYGGVFDDVVPHLTVAGGSDRDALNRIEREITPTLPIHARASQVWLMEHREGSWRLHTGFSLVGRSLSGPDAERP